MKETVQLPEWKRIFALPIWVESFAFQSAEYNAFIKLRIQKSKKGNLTRYLPCKNTLKKPQPNKKT